MSMPNRRNPGTTGAARSRYWDHAAGVNSPPRRSRSRHHAEVREPRFHQRPKFQFYSDKTKFCSGLSLPESLLFCRNGTCKHLKMCLTSRPNTRVRFSSPAPSNFCDLAQILELIPTTAIVIPASRLNTFPTLPVRMRDAPGHVRDWRHQIT